MVSFKKLVNIKKINIKKGRIKKINFSYNHKHYKIEELKEKNQIFREYKKAIDRKDNVSTILIEYADNYNLK
jgi:hypothetical protein